MKKPNKKYTSIYVFMAVMLLIILGCTGYNDSTYKDVRNYIRQIVEFNGEKINFNKAYERKSADLSESVCRVLLILKSKTV